MKKLFVLLAVLAVVGMAVYAIAAPNQVVYEARNGNVTFDHEMHSGTGDCVSCHHNDDGNYSCRSCHDGTTASSGKDARGEFHAFCIDCHKESGMRGTCNECHKR